MKEPNLQRRNLPSHAVLRSFECAARRESFTRAAEELNLTQSAISRQVKELEMTVGTPLFRRVGRRVALTPAGRMLAKDLSNDLENIYRTVMRAISAGEHASALRIAVLPTFASRWLIPRLPEFFAKHPKIEVNLTSRLKPFDLARESFDAAIHFGAEDWPDAEMHILCAEKMVPVASPTFIERQGITQISDLIGVPLLHMQTRPTVWNDLFNEADVSGDISMSGKYFDQFSMIIAGTRASLGAGLIPEYLIENELQSGELVRIGTSTVVTKNKYYFVTPENLNNDQITLFRKWMQATVGYTYIPNSHD
ncbi:MAG: LysR substrate-binding domain-containing protein [Pseudoruegeria sp.]